MRLPKHEEANTTDTVQWSNRIYTQSQDSLPYIRVVSSGMVEKIEVPRDNQKPLANELTKVLTLGSALSVIST